MAISKDLKDALEKQVLTEYDDLELRKIARAEGKHRIEQLKSNDNLFDVDIIKRLSNGIFKLENLFSTVEEIDDSTLIVYHPYRFEGFKPPRARRDENGILHWIHEDIKITRKASFGIKDVVQYAREKFPNVRRSDGDYAIFNWLLTECTKMLIMYKKEIDPKDLILFTIDAANTILERNNDELQKYVQLIDYIKEGMNLYFDKVNLVKDPMRV